MAMNPTIKNLFPAWVTRQRISQIDKKLLMLTHDIDSIMGCAIHRLFYPQDKIFYFYNFKKEYEILGNHTGNDIIAIDANMANIKCWGNHLSMMKDQDGVFCTNTYAANLNMLLPPPPGVFQKINLSTTLVMASFYGLDVSLLSNEACAVLLIIDGIYKDYYNPVFGPMLLDNLENKLGYKYLVEILQDHTKSYFEKIGEKYNLFKPIGISNKKVLETDIKITELQKLFAPWGLDLTLPTQKFKHTKTFKDLKCAPYLTDVPFMDNIRSLAWWRHDKVLYSVLDTTHA